MANTPTTDPMDDAFWDAAVRRILPAPTERLDTLEDDLASLDRDAAADNGATSSDDDDGALEPSEVEAMVNAAIGGHAVRARITTASNRQMRRGLHSLRTAAIVTIALLTTAAIATPLIFWPERHHSSQTLEFVEARDLLTHPGESRGARLIALARSCDRADGIISELRAVLDDDSSPTILRESVRASLARIAAVMTDPSRTVSSPDPDDQGTRNAIAALRNAQLPVEVREQAVLLCERSATYLLVLVRNAGELMPDLEPDYAVRLEQISRAFGSR